MVKKSFKLTLEINDEGVRRLESSGEKERSGDFHDALSNEIGRMLNLASDPMPVSKIMLSMMKFCDEWKNQVFWGLAKLHEDAWGGGSNFEECFEITVDLGKLVDTDNENDLRRFRHICDEAGFKLKETEQP